MPSSAPKPAPAHTTWATLLSETSSPEETRRLLAIQNIAVLIQNHQELSQEAFDKAIEILRANQEHALAEMARELAKALKPEGKKRS